MSVANLTNNQRNFIAYYMSYYECSCNFANHNRADCLTGTDMFTIGAFSFSGGYAYDFMDLMRTHEPTLFAGLPTRWKTVVETSTRDDPLFAYGNTNAITADEANVWSDLVNNNLADMAAFQCWVFIDESSGFGEGVEACLVRCNNCLPIPSTLTATNVKALAHYCHLGNFAPAYTFYQSSSYPNNTPLVSVTGYDATQQQIGDNAIQIYQTFSSWYRYGQGWTRMAYDGDGILASWDGVSAPPNEFIAGTTSTSTGDSGGDEYSSSYVRNVTKHGNRMVVTNHDNTHIYCDKVSFNCWEPSDRIGTSGKPEEQSEIPDSELSDWLSVVMADCITYNCAWDYSLQGDYTHPRTSGFTNCSAWIWYLGETYSVVGTNDYVTYGGYAYTGCIHAVSEHIQYNTVDYAIDYSRIMPLDCINMSYNRHNEDYDHVELFLGTVEQGNTTGSELWGAGSAPCPHVNGNADSIRYWGTYDYCVERFDWGTLNTTMKELLHNLRNVSREMKVKAISDWLINYQTGSFRTFENKLYIPKKHIGGLSR